MLLFTKSIEKKLISNYEKFKYDSYNERPVVKLFLPEGSSYMLLTEYNPEDDLAFGLSYIHCKEIGLVDMREVRAIRSPLFQLPMERDRYYKTKKTINQILYEGDDE
jgi:hypothetical protein|tara:strand:+ start:902 stop:1222 length:321 start_codon:yes stop_codon:yes gene_type:complete